MTTDAGPAPTIHRTRRQRRPSGAPPPLPRSIGTSGKGWIVASVALLVWVVLVTQTHWAQRITERADAAFLRQVARRARRLADGSARARQPTRVGLGRDDRQRRIAHRPDGLPKVAPSLHVRRQRAGRGIDRGVLLRPVPAAASVRRHDHRSLARMGLSFGAGGGRDDHRGRDHLLDGRARSRPHDREGRRVRGHRVGRRRPAVSRRGPSVRRLGEHRDRGGAAAQRVPFLHAQ